MHLIVRLVLGLAAGLVTVFAIDRFLWPGTLVSGAIGVVIAVAVLGAAQLGARRNAPRASGVIASAHVLQNEER